MSFAILNYIYWITAAVIYSWLEGMNSCQPALRLATEQTHAAMAGMEEGLE